jgi:hypothetical protein
MAMQPNIKAFQILTAAVAVYGALLSTYTFWANRRDKRPRVRARISFGFLTLPTGLSPEMLLLECSNPGHVPVTINNPGILLSDGRTLAFIGRQSNVAFPHTLETGRSCTAWEAAGTIVEQLTETGFSGTVRLVPFCRDQIGNTYKGKGVMFDLVHWRKRLSSEGSA